jgi:hypothetical protein
MRDETWFFSLLKCWWIESSGAGRGVSLPARFEFTDVTLLA